MIKTKEITLQDREKAHTFRITELPVQQAQLMMARLISLLLKCGVIDNVMEMDTQKALTEVGKAVQGGGLQKLGLIDPYAANDFMLDLLPCCEYKVDKVYTRLDRDMIDQYICDVRTLLRLEIEVIKLHIDFLQLESASNTQTLDQEKDQDTSKPAMFLRS